MVFKPTKPRTSHKPERDIPFELKTLEAKSARHAEMDETLMGFITFACTVGDVDLPVLFSWLASDDTRQIVLEQNMKFIRVVVRNGSQDRFWAEQVAKRFGRLMYQHWRGHRIVFTIDGDDIDLSNLMQGRPQSAEKIKLWADMTEDERTALLSRLPTYQPGIREVMLRLYQHPDAPPIT